MCVGVNINGNTISFDLSGDNPTFKNNIKTVFNCLLPTQGNNLFNLVNTNFSNQTLNLDGRTVQLTKCSNGIGVDIQ